MEKIKEEFDGREVIELGAGSGLVGIVAALLGMNLVDYIFKVFLSLYFEISW